MNTLKPLVDFYKTHKWGQGQHRYGETVYCLTEARVKIKYHPDGTLNRELRRRCDRGDIVQFNDASGRTFEEVMAMLEQDDTA